MINDFIIHYTVVSSSDNNDNSASAAVISGAIVGTLLLIIVIIIIIIMIMLLYRGRKNSMKARNIDDKHNPPRNTSDQSQHDHTNNNASSQLRVDLEIVNALYIPTNVKYPEQHGHDKSRGDMIGRDVIITPNPSYITSPKSLQTEKQSEYSYAYVQVDKLVQHNKLLESTTSKITDPAGDDVKVDPNPSYYPLQLDDNPSYHKLHLRL